MDEPIEKHVDLKTIPECNLVYSIGTHKAMYKVMSLLPENVIVGGNDFVPGLVDGQTPGRLNLEWNLCGQTDI